MEQGFTFKVLVNEMSEVEVLIPEVLRQEVCSRFAGRMERMEFGFHFYETVEREFPALHQRIVQEIRSQLQIAGEGIYYSSCTDWFEE
jgi:hypothetical protein